MSALRPCPFCGGEAQIMEAAPEDNRHILFRHFSVKCKSCKVIIGNVIHGETDFFDTPEQAAAAWNRRPSGFNTGTQLGWWLN